MLKQDSKKSENRYYGLDNLKQIWLRRQASETFEVHYIDVDEWQQLTHLEKLNFLTKFTNTTESKKFGMTYWRHII